jgi:hypothetical protein
MPVRDVGFFRELAHGDPAGPSLREVVGRGDPAVSDSLARYLDAGSVLAVTGTTATDVLSEDDAEAGRVSIVTDGAWIWPGDLAHYVRRYNVGLPAEFVDAAARRNWVPPELTTKDLARVEHELYPDAGSVPDDARRAGQEGS